MRTLTLPLLLAAVPMFSQSMSSQSMSSQTNDPAKVLFDVGTRDEQAGKLDRAKLSLPTLAATYAESPLTARAKVEIGAIYLFKEAQSQVQAGQLRAAYGAFHTLMAVYPESPLARLADETAKSLGLPAEPPK
jgi:outer membrane protein assembly factor BamD (BamD/ComL family)